MTAEGLFTYFEGFLSTMHEEFDSMLIGFMKHQNDPITIPIKRRELLHDLRNCSSNFDRLCKETSNNWPIKEINTEEDAFADMKLA